MSDRNDVQTAMSDAIDAEKSLDQMKTFTELRGLRPNTVYTFAHCARRFLAHAGKAPADIKAADVESFLLDLSRKGRSPQTRNVNLSAVRCRCLGLRRAHFFPLFEQTRIHGARHTEAGCSWQRQPECLRAICSACGYFWTPRDH